MYSIIVWMREAEILSSLAIANCISSFFFLSLWHNLSRCPVHTRPHTVRRQAWQALCSADRDQASRLSGVRRDPVRVRLTSRLRAPNKLPVQLTAFLSGNNRVFMLWWELPCVWCMNLITFVYSLTCVRSCVSFSNEVSKEALELI